MNQQPSMGTNDRRAGAQHGHGLMMIACCIPMLFIAMLLVATGVASPACLVAALECTATMAA